LRVMIFIVIAPVMSLLMMALNGSDKKQKGENLIRFSPFFFFKGRR